MKKTNNFKNSTVAYAFLLATSPAWANSKTGGGTQPPDKDASAPPSPPISAPQKIGGKTSPVIPPKVDNTTPAKLSFSKIQVEQATANKVTECEIPANVRLRSPKPRRVTSFAFEPEPDKKRVVPLQFVMTNVPVTKDERVLVLLSSRCLSRKSPLKLKQPGNNLALDFKDIRQLGVFNVPAKSSTTESASAVTFDVPLDTEKLDEQVKAGNETFYFQAGLLKKADFDEQHYTDIILSPLEAVHFTSKACPTKKQYKKQIRSTNTSCRELPGKSK